MGMNAIECKGLYAEIGKSEFGEGSRSSSDFDGPDLLVTAGAVAVAALGAAAIAVSLGGREQEPYPAESAKIEYGPFRFGGDNESAVKTIHSQYANRTYQIELEGIEHGSYVTLVPYMAGKVTMMMPITHYYSTGHFSVTDMGSMEKTQVDIGNGGCLDVSESLRVCADVGSEFAEVTVTERYVKPLE